MSHPIHLILSPGTRIVTRNEANRIGGGPLIPTGAVAVITDSPADAQHAYKVPCNDGTGARGGEKDLSHEEVRHLIPAPLHLARGV